MLKKYAVGIDIGGTTAKFGIVDRKGKILEQDRVPSNKHAVVEDFIDDMYAKLMPMIDKAQSMISGLDVDKINNLIGMTEKFGNLGGGLGSLIGSKSTNQAPAK